MTLKETVSTYPWHSLGELPRWLLARWRLLCFGRMIFSLWTALQWSQGTPHT